MVRMISVSVFLVLFLVSVGFGEQEAPKIGDQASSFYLKTLEGKDFFLRDYCGELRPPVIKKKQHVVVLSFFATWCGPCKREIPHLEKIYKRYKSKDVKVVLIDVEEKPPKVSEFLKELQVDLPVLIDRYAAVKQRYGIESLPTLFLIGKEGKIRDIRIGYKEGDEEEVEKEIQEILAETGSKVR